MQWTEILHLRLINMCNMVIRNLDKNPVNFQFHVEKARQDLVRRKGNNKTSVFRQK